MFKSIILLLVICAPSLLSAQVQGIVFGILNGQKVPLQRASVSLKNTTITVFTSEEGRFEFVLPKELPVMMVVQARGYESDSVLLTKEDRFVGLEIILTETTEMDELVVVAQRDSKYISRLKPIMVETLGEGELKKAACCNLSESFETSATVDVNLTDAISGAKKIQMLGLDGVYTQLQMENIPFLTGIESSFGMNTVPGTWVESIQITKGTGSVMNGYESMAGLINVEFKKPRTMERLYVNGYGSILGRGELNLHGGQIINDKWSTATFVHGSLLQTEIDRNKDQFRDVPLSKTLSALNRWEYNGKRFESRFGVSAYSDERVGGQLKAVLNRYDAQTTNKHVDAFAKTGFLFPKKPYQSLGIVYQLKAHEFVSNFDQRTVKSNEKRGYINAIFDGIMGSTIHKYKVGVSFVYQDLQQTLDTFAMKRMVTTPGAFAEYTYTGVRFMAVIGARVDYQEQYGFQFSPRIHMKVTLDEYTDLRLTTGKAFRLSNVIVDNSSLLATSKVWDLPAETQQEVVWNSGASLVRSMRWWNKPASFSVDYYHARFMNQLIVDRERSQDTFFFAFQRNNAFSNALQTELSFSPVKVLTVRLAYKWLQVKAEYDGKLQQQVMIPQHRGLFNIAYASRNKKWAADATFSLFGRMRMHDVMLADGTHLHNQKSGRFPNVLAQFTRNFRWGAVYVGGENLLNFTQKNPIISAENPYGSTFDATRVWAPILGTVVYAGFRLELKRKTE